MFLNLRYILNITTIFCLFAHLPARAFESSSASLILSIDCNIYLRSNCEKLTPWLKSSLQACEINAKAHNCEKIAKELPEIKDLLISCKPQEYCRQYTLSAGEEALSCWNGAKNSVVDTVKVFGLLVETAWQKIQADLAIRAALIASCEKSSHCEGELLKYYQSKPINLTSAAFNVEKNKKKLVDLWNVAEIMATEKNHQYSCYTPEAKEELKCYIFATILDPTLVIGKGVKLAKARRILQTDNLESEVAKNTTLTVSKALSKEQFIAKYLHYTPTNTEQNLTWIAMAEKAPAVKNSKFFDIENSAMKNLNDNLKDKNLVTSLTNYHKVILKTKTEKLLADLKSKYPDFELIAYSDFKASRFAFKGRGPPDLETRLNNILKETNSEFANDVIKSKIVEPLAHPENWFRAGYGETADQANLATRFSRQKSENTLQNYSSLEMKTSMLAKLRETESQRASLQTHLSQTSMLEGDAKKTLRPEALDILRKNEDDLGKAQTALKNRFGLSELPLSTLKKMQNYAKSVDEFAPGIHISERQVANLDEAVFGGFSADMAGMGAKNLSGTAKALSSAIDLDDALVRTRRAEKLVTEQFMKQKDTFQQVVKEVLGPHRSKTVCSGDDCVAIAKQILSNGEKQKILQRLSDAGYSSQFRLSFIPENVSDLAMRNQLSVHGESIEKVLRKNLADKMEPAKLDGILFGVDMKTTELNQGAVKLITASAANVKLSASEQKVISDNFKKAVQQMNEDLTKQGKLSDYQVLNP